MNVCLSLFPSCTGRISLMSSSVPLMRVRLKVIKNEILITMGGWPVSSDKLKAPLEKEALKRDAYKINPETGFMAEYLAFIIN